MTSTKEEEFAASLTERTIRLPDGTKFKIIEATVPESADAQLLLRGMVEPPEEYGLVDDATSKFVGAVDDAALVDDGETRHVYLEGYLDGPEGRKHRFTVTVPLPEKPADPPRTFRVEFTLHAMQAVTISGDLAKLDDNALTIWREGRPAFQCPAGVVAFCHDVTDQMDVAEAGS